MMHLRHRRAVTAFGTCCAAALGLLAGVGAAAAGPGERAFAAAESQLKAADLPTMRVVLRPSLMHGSQTGGTRFGDRGPGCTQVVASRTDANFGGGSFIVEAGMGQGEIAAASYLLPATAFPIKVDLMEVILATSNASVQTVTQWSILVWDGDPSTGTLVAEYSSDGVTLPDALVGPGTAGVNIQVSIDPSDPEQIFCTDANGSHKFSIGFRIDHHNNQVQDPCTTGPSTSTNAFPCVDTSGLSASGDNWLFGLNCGSLGCPANGGWAKFSALPFYCRPSGDWVMRATWESVNCAPPTGACCSSTTCSLNTQTLCTSGGGAYQGDNTACTPTSPCTGACCFSNNTCQVRTASSCAGFGGTYAGNNVACTASNTCPTGACCMPNGSCIASQLASQCAGAGGTLQAIGSTCSPNPCPQPTGACCFTSTGFCSVETQPNCNIPGTTWAGAGTVCSTATCPNTGACCASNGFCSAETSANCSGIPGATFRGIGTSCTPNPCNATGACCCGVSCSVGSSASCVGASSVYLGNNTVCNAAGNNTTPCCRADFNHVGGISVQDIFDYLGGYFSADPCSDFNGSGVSVQDIFDFLGAYFAGGC